MFERTVSSGDVCYSLTVGNKRISFWVWLVPAVFDTPEVINYGRSGRIHWHRYSFFWNL